MGSAVMSVQKNAWGSRSPAGSRTSTQRIGTAAPLWYQTAVAGQIETCGQRIEAMEKEIFAWHKTNEASRNLATIPGIGPITASMLAATITDPSLFKNGRQMASWLGLVPRQNSSGGKDRLTASPVDPDKQFECIIHGYLSFFRRIGHGHSVTTVAPVRALRGCIQTRRNSLLDICHSLPHWGAVSTGGDSLAICRWSLPGR